MALDTKQQTARDGADVAIDYTSGPETGRIRLIRRATLFGVIAFCLLYGMAFAFFAPYLLVAFLAPIVILMLVSIWALPSTGRAPTKTLEWLFFAFFIALVIWPYYLALALPGLPWITFSRLTGIPAVFGLLLSFSLSKSFSSEVMSTVKSIPILWGLILTFTALEFISIGFSSQKSQSVDKFIVAQTSWTTMLLIASYVFKKPGRVQRWAYILWAMAVFTCIIGVFEHRAGKVLWAGHIPSFLKIDDPNVQRNLAGFTRAFTNMYRSQSTFGTSLDFAEYLSFSYPFVFHFIASKNPLYIRILAVLTVPLMLYVAQVTGSRIAVIGFIISALTYTLYLGVKRWRRDRRSLVGAAIVLSYPAMATLALGAILIFHRLRTMVFGGGDTVASNEGRAQQIVLGMAKIIHNPFGYGIGLGGETVGYYTPGGLLTIDNYYLVVIVEFGVIGLAVYLSIIVCAIFNAGKYALFDKSGDPEIQFLAPTCIALMNFLVIRAVFSNQQNLPLFFMLLGMVFALVSRSQAAAGSAPAGTLLSPRPPRMA